MKNKTMITDSPSHCANMVLGAVALCTNLFEPHGLVSFGCGSVARLASWCGGLTSLLFFFVNL
jgi:hypothetical protein